MRRIDPGAAAPSPLGLGAAAAAVALVAVATTLGDYGIASDVGNYFTASLLQLDWLGRLARETLAGTPGEALGREVVLEHWRMSPLRVPHPPLSREIGALSYAAFGWLLDPLPAYRVGVGVTYAALVGACAGFTAWATRSRLAGASAAAAALTVPALFAHGHLAATDLFLAAFWFGSVASLEAHLRSGRRAWLVASALLFGAAAATKFSGLLLAPVLGGWVLFREVSGTWTARRSDGAAAAAAGGIRGSARRILVRGAVLALGGAAVVFATNPVLWVDPALGLSDYLGAGFGRAGLEAAQIPTHYLGRTWVYRPPWHYPYVWTAAVLPIPILLAALVGTAGAAALRSGRLVGLCLLNLAVQYGVFLLPSAPLHDGIRLLLPAFPFLCVLAGLGVAVAAKALRAPLPGGRRALAGALLFVAVFALPTWRTAEYHPYQLSYFNALVGGVRGAEARGLEISNLKEALTPSLLEELAARIPGDAVLNPGFFLEEMCFYRAAGYAPRGWTLEADLWRPGMTRPFAWTCTGPDVFTAVTRPRPAARPDYVFVLNRKGMYTPVERALTHFGGDPFFKLGLDGVPLLRVYRVGERPASVADGGAAAAAGREGAP